MKDKPVLMVPMEVAVAVSTERLVFVDMLSRKLEKGELLDQELQRGMVDLLRQFIEERIEMRRGMQALDDLCIQLNQFGQRSGK